jgi:hypothetical protein
MFRVVVSGRLGDEGKRGKLELIVVR